MPPGRRYGSEPRDRRKRALLAQGRGAEALAAARQARAIVPDATGFERGESLLRLLEARALEATGAHEEAARALTEARERLKIRAARLPTRWRESFLESIEENRETMKDR